MRKYLAFLCAAVLGILTLAPVQAKADEGYRPERMLKLTAVKDKTETLTFKVGNTSVKMTSTYPQYALAGDKKVNRKLNKAVRKAFTTSTKEWFADPINSEWYEGVKQLDIEVTAYAVLTYRYGNLISINARCLTSADGAINKDVVWLSEAFDLKTGKRVTMEQLFDTDALYKKLAKLVLKDIKDWKAEITEEEQAEIFYPKVTSKDIVKAFKQKRIGVSLNPSNVYVRFSDLILGPWTSAGFYFAYPVTEVMEYAKARDQLFSPLGATTYTFEVDRASGDLCKLEIISGSDIVYVTEYDYIATNELMSEKIFGVAALKPGRATLRKSIVDANGGVVDGSVMEWDVIVTDDYFITEDNGEW